MRHFLPFLQAIALLAKSIIIVLYMVVCWEKQKVNTTTYLGLHLNFFSVPRRPYAFIGFFQGKKRGEGQSWHVLLSDRKKRKYQQRKINHLINTSGNGVTKTQVQQWGGGKGSREWTDMLSHSLTSFPPHTFKSSHKALVSSSKHDFTFIWLLWTILWPLWHEFLATT